MPGKKVAIDLGTANSVVYILGQGIVVREPTVVAVAVDDKKIIAVGQDAKNMLGKVPGNIVARRPMRQGVIASYKLTEALIRNLLDKALGRFRFFKPQVMISVPAGITSVEERAVIEAVSSAGASRVYLIPEPLAASVGAKLPISTSAGNMIVNMGGGTAEIAVISMNGIVAFESKRVAGDAINEAIQVHMRKKYNLLIGEQMAELIKMQIGSATLLKNPLEMDVRGRSATGGLPMSIIVNSNDVVDVIKGVLHQVITSIKNVLEKTPPELASDIIDRGMVLSGGTAMLRNIDELFTRATGVPAHVVDEPLDTVVLGVAEAFTHLDAIRRSLKAG